LSAEEEMEDEEDEEEGEEKWKEALPYVVRREGEVEERKRDQHEGL
jgi:hypothetical protein